MLRILSPLLVVFALGFVGCGEGTPPGPPRGPVKGRVTVNGTPLANVTVEFSCPEAGIDQTAGTDENGNYEFVAYNATGLPAGSYKVGVTAGQFMKPGEEIPLVDPNRRIAAPAPKPKASAVNERYAKPEKSGLTADVKAGANDPFHFDLKP